MRDVSFIRGDDDTGYAISFPNFPGCVSVGDSVDEAIRHGREALTGDAEVNLTELSDEALMDLVRLDVTRAAT